MEIKNCFYLLRSSIIECSDLYNPLYILNKNECKIVITKYNKYNYLTINSLL